MPTTSQARQPHTWNRDRVNWEIAFAIVLIATCALVLASTDLAQWRRTTSTILLLAQVPAYIWLGRDVVGRDHPHAHPWRYIGVVIALFVPASTLTPQSGVALFGLAPLYFLTLPPGRATLALAATNVVPVTTLLFLEGQGPYNSRILGVAILALGVVFAYFFGRWIHYTVSQSIERAELIRHLDATRAELAEMNRYAGALAERQYLAREVHDTLAQGFTGILMLLDDVENAPNADERLSMARQAARDNLAQARSLVTGSREVAPLRESLRLAAERLSHEAAIAVEFNLEGDARALSAPLELGLLRMAQESLSNVRKHARASQVSVTIEYPIDAVVLRIRDDGLGFDPGVETAGFGLLGMRERAESVNGQLDVLSTVGEGTTIEVRVPT